MSTIVDIRRLKVKIIVCVLLCTAVLLTPVYVKEMWTSLYRFLPLLPPSKRWSRDRPGYLCSSFGYGHPHWKVGKDAPLDFELIWLNLMCG